MSHNRVKQYREGMGIKQEALATRVGVTQSEISRIEQGRREPGVYLALRISRVLGVGVDILFVED